MLSALRAVQVEQNSVDIYSSRPLKATGGPDSRQRYSGSLVFKERRRTVVRSTALKVPAVFAVILRHALPLPLCFHTLFALSNATTRCPQPCSKISFSAPNPLNTSHGAEWVVGFGHTAHVSAVLVSNLNMHCVQQCPYHRVDEFLS